MSKLGIYWLSYPTRRHSQDIAVNNRVALTVAIKPDLPVIGVQIEGEAGGVTDMGRAEAIMQRYVDKYDEGSERCGY